MLQNPWTRRCESVALTRRTLVVRLLQLAGVATVIIVPRGTTFAQSPVSDQTCALLDQIPDRPVWHNSATPEPLDDRAAIAAMIDLHVRAIAIANVGLQLAQDSRVRRIALRVAEGQAGEIQLMRSWLATWYPAAMQSVTPGTPAPTLRSLCDQAPGFDQRFLVVLIDEHHAAIDLASAIEQSAVHPELRAFAQTTKEARETEIVLMQTILEDLSRPSITATP